LPKKKKKKKGGKKKEHQQFPCMQSRHKLRFIQIGLKGSGKTKRGTGERKKPVRLLSPPEQNNGRGAGGNAREGRREDLGSTFLFIHRKKEKKGRVRERGERRRKGKVEKYFLIGERKRKKKGGKKKGGLFFLTNSSLFGLLGGRGGASPKGGGTTYRHPSLWKKRKHKNLSSEWSGRISFP